MFNKEPFKVGDKVTVSASKPHRISKVVRVLKKFVELEDGTKWSQDGNKYPYEPYGWWTISHWKQADSDAIKLQNLKYRIEKFMDTNRHTWTLEQAEAIYAAVKLFEVEEDQTK